MSQPPNNAPMPASLGGPAARPGQIAWESRPDWGTFRTGLLLMIFGLGLQFLVIAGTFMVGLMAISAVSSARPGQMPSPEAAANMASFLAVLVLAGWGCAILGGFWILTGFFLTPSVPLESGASVWATLSFLGLLGTFGVYAAMASETVRRGGKVMDELISVGSLAGKEGLKPDVPALEKAAQGMSLETLKYLQYALFGCVALTKLAFTLTLWQVARFFDYHRLAFCILLWLLFYILAYGFVALTLSGHPPVLKDDPKALAGVVGLISTFGVFILALWMLFLLMGVRGAVSEGLLKREAAPAA